MQKKKQKVSRIAWEANDPITVPITGCTTIYCDQNAIALAEQFLKKTGDVPEWVFDLMFGDALKDLQQTSSSGSTGFTE